MSRPFEELEGHRYVSLTTYRLNGEAVPTTVWFALVGESLYVFTDLHSGKAKRIRNRPEVLLTPSNALGRPKGPSVEAEARLMDHAEEGVAERAITRKYGWQFRLFNRVLGLSKNPPEHVFLQIEPSGIR